MSVQGESGQVFCGNCGAKNAKGQRFCSGCGAELSASGAAPMESKPTKKSGGLRRGCMIGLGIVVVLIIGLFAMMALTGGDADETATTSGASSQTGSGGEEAVAPAVHTVGQDVQVGEVRWTVVEVVDEGQTLDSDNQFIDDKTTTGKFIRVTFEMENLSKDMLTYTGLDLVDDQGREFKSSTDVYGFIDDDKECILLENLNPNVPQTCQTIYELPANATGVSLEVTNLKLLGGKDTLISLGLD